VILTEGLEVVMASLWAKSMLDTQQTRQGYSLYGRLTRKSESSAQQEFCCVSTRERTENGERSLDIVPLA
jgi:hypothetical protein